MYKLKNIYEKQRGATPQQPNSNNWNDGSFLAHLLKKSQSKNFIESITLSISLG